MLPGLLLCCIALLTLFPRAVCALTPKQPEPAGTGLPLWRGPSPVTVPFEYFEQHILVTVTINGKPGYVFMLDSGANRNVLNMRTARALGLDPGTVSQRKKIGYGASPIYTAPEQQVEVRIANVAVAGHVSVLDMSAFERHFGHATDGMLGYPFLQHFIVSIDYGHKLLTLIPAHSHRHTYGSVAVPLVPSEDFPVIPITVNDNGYSQQNIKATIDTGSNGMLIIFDQYVRTLKLHDSRARATPDVCLGLDGYFPVNIGIVHQLIVGEAGAQNIPVDYLAQEQEVGPDARYPGAIGNGILENFQKVTFDVPHHRMLFTLKPQPIISADVVRYAATP
jgi:hypothetical protein